MLLALDPYSKAISPQKGWWRAPSHTGNQTLPQRNLVTLGDTSELTEVDENNDQSYETGTSLVCSVAVHIHSSSR